MLEGIFTAVATPMKNSPSQPQIDWDAFDRLLEMQKLAGVQGVVPCGTTGESPTLTKDEKKKLISRSIEFFKETETKVIAGTGSNNTSESVEMSAWASDQGADGVLLVSPYYNKPSQTGLIEHFTRIADQIKCEAVVYNVPARTIVSIEPKTLATLAKHPQITTVKEASGDSNFLSRVIAALDEENVQLQILSGDDPTFFSFSSLGMQGCISVVSNLIPKEMVQMWKHIQAGETDAAKKINKRYQTLYKELFVEANPIPLKFAMSESLGIGDGSLRLPLTSLDEKYRESFRQTLRRCELLK